MRPGLEDERRKRIRGRVDCFQSPAPRLRFFLVRARGPTGMVDITEPFSAVSSTFLPGHMPTVGHGNGIVPPKAMT